MPRKSIEKPLKLAKLLCEESVIIFGRRSDGKPDKCFEEGAEYLFCVDEKKDEIFTFDDVKQIHFLGLNDEYTDNHFKIIEVKEADKFGLDELSLTRFKRLYKDRYDFEE